MLGTLPENLARQIESLLLQVDSHAAMPTRADEYLTPLTRLLIDNLRDALYVHFLYPDGSCSPFLLTNRTASQQLGYSIEELLKMTPMQINDPELGRAVLTGAYAMLSENGHALFHMVHLRKDGERLPVEIDARAIVMEEGLLVLSLVRSRAEAQQASEALRLSEVRCHTILNHAPFGMLECEPDANGVLCVRTVNRAAQRLLGASPQSLLGRPLMQIVPALEENGWPEHLKRAIETGAEHFCEALPCRAGHVQGTFEVSLFSTSPGRVCLALHDITARQQARQAREREARTRQVLYRTMANLNRCDGLDDALPTLMQAAIELTGAEFGAIHLVEGEEAVMHYDHGLPRDFRMRVEHIKMNDPWVEAVCSAASPRNLHDLQRPEISNALREFGIELACAVPLRSDGRIFGILGVASRSPAPIDPAMLDNLTILAADTESLLGRLSSATALRMTQYSLDHSSTAVYWIASDGRILYCNTIAAERLGYTPAEMMEMSVLQLAEEMTAEEWSARWESLRVNGTRNVRGSHRHRDGHLIPIEVHANYIVFEGQEFNFAFVQDLSERHQAEQALAESETKFRTLVENLPGVVYRCEATRPWRPVFTSDSAENLFSRAEDGEPVSHFAAIHEEDRAAVEAQLEACLREGGNFSLEYRLRHEDGPGRWMHDRGRVVLDAQGQPRWIDGVIFDITRRRQSDEERQRLSAAIEQCSEVIVITDSEGDIEYANPAFEKITGYSRLEVLGGNPRVLKSGRHGVEFYREMWETLTAGNNWRGQLINRRKNGTLYSEDAVISPVRNTAGEITNYVAVKRDITKEQELEAQLRQAQKMEAVGKLAGGVAHDFNNLLQVINGYTELGRAMVPSDHKIHEPLQQVQAAGERAARLVSQLLAFSRRQIIQPEDLDLNEVISTLMKMMSRVIGEHIEIEYRLGADLGAVRADRGQIEQILMNLCVNARDAMTRGGRLRLETSHQTLDANFVAEQPWARSGEYVLLSVSDSGTGMDAETLEHIFEPFFTTKGVGEGTGLGLATIYGIVQQHEGLIRVFSEPEKGTTFHLYLPASTPARVRAPQSGRGADWVGGKETILLAEDDEMVRRLARLILEGAGYTVLVAHDGAEAITLYERNAGSVDLLLLDVVMPQLGGHEALDRIRGINPQIPVLFASGYSETALHNNYVLEDNLQYIQKPYNPSDLLQKVRSILDERNRGSALHAAAARQAQQSNAAGTTD